MVLLNHANTDLNVQRLFTKKLIFFQIYYNLAIKFFIGQFGFPHSLNYITDVVTFVIVLLSVGELRAGYYKNKFIYHLIFLLMLFTVIGYLFNLYSPLLYLWGLRNTFRFFVFFLCCTVLLEKKDIKKIIAILMKLLPLNVILCTYQYFTLRNSGGYVSLYLGDFIGGMFGPMQGSNVAMNVYLSILLIMLLAAFIEKKVSFAKFGLYTSMCFYIAILAEMKIVFFDFLIILIMIMLISRISFKKIASFLLGIVVLLGVLNIWTNFNPESSAYLTNWDSIIEYTGKTSYAGTSSLNRLTAIPMISTIFFQNNVGGNLVGIGLGNADTSNIAAFNSLTYATYGDILKYTYFQQAILYLETGWIGLLLYLCFFIVIFFSTFLNSKIRWANNEEYIYILLARVFSILAIVMVFYNQSFRLESSGYLAFLILAIPFIWRNRHQEELSK
ncbi:hypothetical protein [Ureibacillus sinduriensis]|uniref:Polysaccharide polymerase n=1 Tax=Ureibacillus sinduriensis BLB-1 = JCM 15800 TaxID=1384057 RepID=A0A0A3HN49_9BACL|nr:hypothetical protein [Ureibacillus sinduriensis]KGR73996.1 hypothetical protein CD33_18505 [Ureibacillus sinduriensis BLB-1 = JCM 15800]